MPTSTLPLIPGTLPPGVCYPDEQTRLNAFMGVSSAQLTGGLAFYNYGATKPDVANQGYPWIYTGDMNVYQFVGVWRRPRPLIEQSTGYRILWTGLEADIPTLGGGNTGTPGIDSGPMWEIDHAFDGRSPMGPGTIPTSNPSKALSVNEAYGEGAHLQTVAELATHNHPPVADSADGFLCHGLVPGAFNILGGTDTINLGTTGDTGGTGTPPVTQTMPVIHPVLGTWILKPTNRLYLVIP